VSPCLGAGLKDVRLGLFLIAQNTYASVCVLESPILNLESIAVASAEPPIQSCVFQDRRL